MPDLSSITLPNNVTYNFKDATARESIASEVPTQAAISNTGLITYKNANGTALFTLQLPLYTGSVT